MKSYLGWVAVGAGLFAGAARATVDLNSATAAQFEKELGLTRGESIKIIQQREKQPFSSPDGLSQVPGFDAQKASQLKGKLTASPPAAKMAKATKAKKATKKKSARKAKATKQSKALPRTSGVNSEMGGGLRQGFASSRGSPGRGGSSAAPRITIR
jgi:helix-hairpin-helix protein